MKIMTSLQVYLIILALFATPSLADNSASIDKVVEWFASKVSKHSRRHQGSVGDWTHRESLKLINLQNCIVKFEKNTISVSPSGMNSSRVEIITTVPIGKISANSVHLAEDENVPGSFVMFEAASGKPYHKVTKTYSKIAEGNSLQLKGENVREEDYYQIWVSGLFIGTRLVSALKHLADVCDAENEPF